MASFKICIRGRRSDGLFPVYIRLTHNRKIGYIRTSKTISKEGIKKGEVIDPTVLAFCSKQISSECIGTQVPMEQNDPPMKSLQALSNLSANPHHI